MSDYYSRAASNHPNIRYLLFMALKFDLITQTAAHFKSPKKHTDNPRNRLLKTSGDSKLPKTGEWSSVSKCCPCDKSDRHKKISVQTFNLFLKGILCPDLGIFMTKQ